MTGFEPATSGSQSRRSARLSYIPVALSGSLEVTWERVNEHNAAKSFESFRQAPIGLDPTLTTKQRPQRSAWCLSSCQAASPECERTGM